MTRRRRILQVTLGLICVVWVSGAHATVDRSHRKTPRNRTRIEEKTRTKTVGKQALRREVDASAVAFTVLPGDTHARLAADLTGKDGNEKLLRRIDPTLTPGDKIKVPEELLRPGLSDTRREALVFGRKYPTLWSVARQAGARSAADVGRTARNLQRMNAILVASRVAPGTKILVPRSWLAPAEDGHRSAAPGSELPIAEPAAKEVREVPLFELDRGVVGVGGMKKEAAANPAEREAAAKPLDGEPVAKPAEMEVVAKPMAPEAVPGTFEILKTYRAKDFDGLERRGATLPNRLRHFLGEKDFGQAQLDRGAVNLVVLHTTEHRGSNFENTATYIRRKRLANYVIGPDGAVYEIVPEEYRAYGCGDSVWDGKYTVDLEAINIEIFANTEKGSHQGPISEAQYNGLRALLANIRARRPKIDEGRIVTHKMVALNLKTGTRSRKGDPYEFDWEKVGLPDNSKVADRDVLEGRAKVCTDCRFADRVTVGQTEAARILQKL